MIKKIFRILKTVIIVLLIFFLIILLDLFTSVLKKSCSEENSQCPENYLCSFSKKICVQAESCPEQKPEVCITLVDPVCTNGREYSNSCYACMEGEKSYYNGQC